MTAVSDELIAPPIWHPIFITPETAPAELPPTSALTDQNELCDRYKAPAPPARTITAKGTLFTWVPATRNTAQRTVDTAATMQRPA